jgi:hypothetical protein
MANEQVVDSSPSSRKTYPLTPSQLSIFFAWKWSFHKQVMNVPTSFFVDEPLDLALLKQAAAQAVSRNDAFGLRITKQGKDRVQYFSDRKVVLLETLDFAGSTQERMEAFFYRVGRKPFKLYDQPLAKLYIVKAPDGRCGMFSCFSHLIMDAWGMSAFFRDMMAVYASLKDGAPMPKPLRSYEKIVEREAAYRGSEQYKEDLAFWFKEIVEPEIKPVGVHINGSIVLQKWRKFIRKPDHRFFRATMLKSAARHEVLFVDKDDVDSMKRFCQESTFPSIYLLFQMGIRTFLAKVNDRAKAVTYYNTVARRSTLDEKYCGGTRIHFLYFTTVMDEDVTFRQALDIMLEKQNTIYRHADFSPLENFDLAYNNIGMRPGEDYSALSVTYQPVAMDLGNNMKVSTNWYCNGASGINCYLTIMDYDGTGAFRCYYEYQKSVFTPERLRLFHHFMLKVIRAGIANPQITLKELIDLEL